MLGMTEGKLILTAIIYLIAYIMDPFIQTYAFMMLLKPKHKSKVFNRIICFGVIYALVCIKQALLFFVNFKYGSVMVVLNLVYILFIGFFLFRGSARRKILAVVLVYTIGLAVEAMYSILFLVIKMDASQLATFSLKSALLTLVMRMTDLLVFLTLKNYYELIKEKCKKPYMIVVYIILFILSGVALGYYSGMEHISVMFGIYCVQAIIIIIFFTFVSLTLRQVMDREEAAVKRADLTESKMAFLEYSREIYEEIKSIRHDTRRHYNYLLELSRREHCQPVTEYLEELCGQLKATEDVSVCDNLILQVALSNASRRAKKENIKFETITAVGTFPFTDSELNSVLTNMLDNAMEAASKVTEGEKYVYLEIRYINQHEMEIYCENTYNPEEYHFIPNFSPGGINRSNHGYGTKIVRKIVKKHKGSILYWNDSDKFYVKIIVRGREQDEDFDM